MPKKKILKKRQKQKPKPQHKKDSILDTPEAKMAMVNAECGGLRGKEYNACAEDVLAGVPTSKPTP